jgi:hypothetical protein
MVKFFELLSKFILLPLFEKLGKWAYSEFKEWQKKRETSKQIKQDTKAMIDAKTKEEIEAAHRRNTNF